MPVSNWKSEEAEEHFRQLTRSEFAVEFLRRNADYREDYYRTNQRIERGEVEAESALLALASRWGLRSRG